jgi:predicted nucleotide-binding protein
VTRLTGGEAIVLHQQPNKGQTIIEKFERHAHEAGFVIVLATADDLGRARTSVDPKPRARQNVVFELGFFVGALGRDKVVIIHDEDVELPSDMAGVLYVPNDGAGNWKSALAKELREAGLTIEDSPSTTEL